MDSQTLQLLVWVYYCPRSHNNYHEWIIERYTIVSPAVCLFEKLLSLCHVWWICGFHNILFSIRLWDVNHINKLVIIYHSNYLTGFRKWWVVTLKSSISGIQNVYFINSIPEMKRSRAVDKSRYFYFYSATSESKVMSTQSPWAPWGPRGPTG